MKRVNVTLEIAAVTDAGRRKGGNQDNFYVNGCYIERYNAGAERFETVDTEETHILAVCDGMGGLKDGDVAAMLGVTALADLSEELRNAHSYNMASLATNRIVHEANSRILRMGKKKRKKMGSTFAMLTVTSDYLYACNLGDSEIYHKSRYSMDRLSKPQTVAQELLDRGTISESQASQSYVRNQLSKYLGMENLKGLKPNECGSEIHNDDILLICSDGISDVLPVHTIYACLNSSRPVKEIADTIIEKALRRGSGDNLTVVIARVVDDGKETRLRRMLALLLGIVTGLAVLLWLLFWLL